MNDVQLSRVQFEVLKTTNRAVIVFVVDGNLVYRVDFNGKSKLIDFQKFERLAEGEWKTIGSVKFDS